MAASVASKSRGCINGIKYVSSLYVTGISRTGYQPRINEPTISNNLLSVVELEADAPGSALDEVGNTLEIKTMIPIRIRWPTQNIRQNAILIEQERIRAIIIRRYAIATLSAGLRREVGTDSI